MRPGISLRVTTRRLSKARRSWRSSTRLGRQSTRSTFRRLDMSRCRGRRSISNLADRCPTAAGFLAPMDLSGPSSGWCGRILHGHGFTSHELNRARFGEVRSSRPRSWTKSVTRHDAITPQLIFCTQPCDRCWERMSSKRVRSSRPIVCGSTSRTCHLSHPTNSFGSSASSTTTSCATRRW